MRALRGGPQQSPHPRLGLKDLSESKSPETLTDLLRTLERSQDLRPLARECGLSLRELRRRLAAGAVVTADVPAHALMAGVEPTAVSLSQPLHPLAQVPIGRLDNAVVVVPQKAIGMDHKPVPLADFPQQR